MIIMVAFSLLTKKISLNIVFTMGTVRDSEEVVANKEKEHLILKQFGSMMSFMLLTSNLSFQKESKTTFETCHK